LGSETRSKATPAPLAPTIPAVYVGLGRNDLALDCLEKAVENRSSWLVWLDVEPWWDPLRKDPRFRFQRIRARIKAPTEEHCLPGAEVAGKQGEMKGINQ
jgi:hypothetical protein